MRLYYRVCIVFGPVLVLSYIFELLSLEVIKLENSLKLKKAQ